MGCKCSEDGYIHLCATSRGDIDINLIDKKIELDDAYSNRIEDLLDINYCPICGQDLRGGDNMKGIETTLAFDTSYFEKGQAFLLEFSSGVKTCALLEYSEPYELKFVSIAKSRLDFTGVDGIYVRIKDIDHVKITKLVPEVGYNE